MTLRWCDEQLYAGLCDPVRSLRIVHLCKFFPPERGGMETYVRDLALEQGSTGHDVTVLAHTVGVSRRESLSERCVVWRSRVWMRAGEYVPVAPGLYWNLRRTLRVVRPHIVHVHCPNPAALWCVLMLGRKDCVGSLPSLPRFVVHWHSDVIFPKERQPSKTSLALWRRMENALLARADRIIATSQPYLESSEFLAPWRDKCVVAPLRLRDCKPGGALGSGVMQSGVAGNGGMRSGALGSGVTDVQHPALDFLRGDAKNSARGDVACGDANLGRTVFDGASSVVKSADAHSSRAALDAASSVVKSADANLGRAAFDAASSVVKSADAASADAVCEPVIGVANTSRAVLAVGRLAHYKGFDVLLRAVAAAPSLRCCIVGEGEEGPALRALVKELGIEDRVLLAGEVDDDVLAACYEACDVFCLPSILRTEAFGVVLLEALRAGKWCVVSNVPGSGMGTVIEDGINGRLVEPGDVGALSAALSATLASEEYI